MIFLKWWKISNCTSVEKKEERENYTSKLRLVLSFFEIFKMKINNIFFPIESKDIIVIKLYF